MKSILLNTSVYYTKLVNPQKSCVMCRIHLVIINNGIEILVKKSLGKLIPLNWHRLKLNSHSMLAGQYYSAYLVKCDGSFEFRLIERILFTLYLFMYHMFR